MSAVLLWTYLSWTAETVSGLSPLRHLPVVTGDGDGNSTELNYIALRKGNLQEIRPLWGVVWRSEGSTGR